MVATAPKYTDGSDPSYPHKQVSQASGVSDNQISSQSVPKDQIASKPLVSSRKAGDQRRDGGMDTSTMSAGKRSYMDSTRRADDEMSHGRGGSQAKLATLLENEE